MESKLHSLPPLKRFRLLHQENQHHESALPTKKRKQPRQSSHLTPSTPPTTFCLPAKKRVWAIPPDFSPPKSPPSSPSFDLNVEYTPSPRKEGRETNENNNTHRESPLGSIRGDSNVGSLTPESREANFEKLIVEYTPSPQKKERETNNSNNRCGSPLTSICKESDAGSLTPAENGYFGKIEPEKPNPDQTNQEEEEEDDGILCAVCESTDGDPEDPIVFCDGCELMVHASCYGNPLVKGIPEGDWFCAQCSVSNPFVSPEKCCLCPVSGGAMKPTTDGKWAHITCAVLVPEVFFEDPEGREGINLEKIPKKRWREVCYVCEGRKGCVVECSEPKCKLGFHVSCGLKEELCIELKEGKSSGGIVAAFCKDHTLLWKKQQQTGKFRIVAREEHSTKR